MCAQCVAQTLKLPSTFRPFVACLSKTLAAPLLLSQAQRARIEANWAAALLKQEERRKKQAEEDARKQKAEEEEQKKAESDSSIITKSSSSIAHCVIFCYVG